MDTIHDKIVNNRLELIKKEKEVLPLKDAEIRVEERLGTGYTPLSFLEKHDAGRPFLIAEIKKASPSKGLIRGDFDVSSIAGAYETSPYVRAVSVLAEPDFFMGSYENVEIASGVLSRPVLLKDFVVDPYQVYRGFLCGASAFLLISSILTDDQIIEFRGLAEKLGMEILFEVHSPDEYRRAVDLDMRLIGINNRDLKTFKTSIQNTLNIIQSEGKPHGSMVISESGIKSREDIAALSSGGADGFLIGEEFMKHDDIEKAIERLMS